MFSFRAKGLKKVKQEQHLQCNDGSLVSRLDQLICCDCRVTTDELCCTLSVSKGSVGTAVKKLGCWKLCLRWVHEC